MSADQQYTIEQVSPARAIRRRQRAGPGGGRPRPERGAGLDRQLNEFLESEHLKKEKEQELIKIERQQAELQKKLSEERDSRFTIRKDIADRLNRDLSPTIRVTLVQDGDTTCYRELLEEHLKPMNMRHVNVAQRLVQSTPPCQLATIVRSGDLKVLMEQGDLNPDQAAKVMQAFNDPVRLAELESVDRRPYVQFSDVDALL